MIETIMLLLVLFQMKHFVADFPLQNTYMLGKMKHKGWMLPLAAHTSVHALGTFIIVSYWDIKLAVILACLDFILHFIVDRLKASPNIGGILKIYKPYFWWALGLDQMSHHLINYMFIFIIIERV